MDHFRNQVAVITGASSGIGRAIALGLAHEGVALVLIGRNIDRLEEVAGLARICSPHVRKITCDLNRESDLCSLTLTLKNDLPKVDLLIHSAGTICFGDIKNEPVEDLDTLYRINLRAPYLITQALLPAVKACQGQVIFINSSCGLAKSNGKNGLYAAMKHALRVFADNLRDEVNPDGVRVISLFTGRTATPMQAYVHQFEGRPYRPELLIQPEDLVTLLMQAVTLPRTIEVTDLLFRPLVKSS